MGEAESSLEGDESADLGGAVTRVVSGGTYLFCPIWSEATKIETETAPSTLVVLSPKSWTTSAIIFFETHFCADLEYLLKQPFTI
jgi:hypothetical protein